MSANPRDSSGDFVSSQVVSTETPWEKLKRKSRREPYVPLGVLTTIVILGFGLRAFKKGDKNRSQVMMRYRVAAQGATVLAIALGILLIPKDEHLKDA